MDWRTADKLVYMVTGGAVYAWLGWIGWLGAMGGVALGDWLLSRFGKQGSR